MTLRNDFYYITDTQPQNPSLPDGLAEFACTIRFNPDHYIYQAHFPGQPITPGVCLVQIATELLEYVSGMDVVLTNACNIKFRSLVTPELTPTYSFSKIKCEGDTVNVHVSIDHNGKQYARMILIYRKR